MALALTPAWGADEVANQLDTTYRAGELSVDAYGTAALGQYSLNHLSGDRVRRNTVLGGGLGVNYFFLQYLGAGIETDSQNGPGAFVSSAAGNVILRFPLGCCGLAPYVLGGGGYRFDEVKTSFGQAGAGVEFRFTPHWGLFADARAVLPTDTKSYGLARFGVRYAF